MRSWRPLAIIFGVFVGIALLSSFGMGGMMGGAMGPGMMYGYGLTGWGAGLTMGLGLLMMFAFWGAIGVGIAMLVRAVLGGPVRAHEHGDPLTILQRRYAAGEIDRETFDRMRRDLEPGGPTELRQVS